MSKLSPLTYLKTSLLAGLVLTGHILEVRADEVRSVNAADILPVARSDKGGMTSAGQGVVPAVPVTPAADRPLATRVPRATGLSEPDLSIPPLQISSVVRSDSNPPTDAVHFGKLQFLHLTGRNLGQPNVRVSSYDSDIPALGSPHACGNDCLILTINVPLRHCGYRNFSLSLGDAHASSRVFVTPDYLAADFRKVPHSVDYELVQSRAERLEFEFGNQVRLMRDGDQFRGIIAYSGGLSGRVLRLSSRHPGNAQISPQSITLPAGAARFNYSVTFSHPRNQCLDDLFLVTGRLDGDSTLRNFISIPFYVIPANQ
jgi:hypothetical protein